MLFFGIAANIFVITVSYDFNYTPVITGPMLLATLYLLAWDWDRLRPLFGAPPREFRFPEHRLDGRVERGAYVAGALAGVAFFTGMRGVLVPAPAMYPALALCALCLAVAVGYGLRRRPGEAQGNLARPAA